MKKNFISLLAVSSLAAVCALGAYAADDKDRAGQDKDRSAQKHDHKHEAKAKLGERAPNFTLPTTDGKEWSLADAKGKIVVLQWVNGQCPVCERVMGDGTVADALKELAPMGVVYVAINSSANVPASLDATGAYLAAHKIAIPGLLDRDGKVGHLYGARTTPHCYVIDAEGILRYNGAIDDGNPGNKGDTNYVVNAVRQIKSGETVAPDTTRPYGCSVKYKK